jgi:hypothetical protein
MPHDIPQPLPRLASQGTIRQHDPYRPVVDTRPIIVHEHTTIPCVAAGNEAARTRLLKEARALSHADIRAYLKGRADGSILRVVWRQGDNVLEWFGTISRRDGTSRAPRWRIEYFADADGPLVADDDTTIVREHASLPPSATEAIEIIAITATDDVSARTRSAPPLGVAATIPLANTPDTVTNEAATPTRPLSNYAHVPDDGEVADEALLRMWLPAPPVISGSTLRGVSTAIHGSEFLRVTATLLSYHDAKDAALPVVWAAVVESVRRGHIAAIAALREYIITYGELAHTAPLDLLVALHIDLQRFGKSWRWSTVSRHAAELIGALAALPLYAPTAPSIGIANLPHVHALLQTAKRLSHAQGHHEPSICTAHHVVAALTLPSTSPRTRALLALCWVSAQRPCDILQMKTEFLSVTPDGGVTLKIVMGKTAGSQGPHHVHSCVMHPEMLSAIQYWLDQAKTSKRAFLFPLSSPYHRALVMRELRTALRSVEGSLEARSLRRGTLCAMARAGASDTELLMWSRHTTKEALHRYLYYEKEPHAEHQVMQRLAASALVPTSMPIVTGGEPCEGIEHTSGGLISVLDGIPMIAHERAPKLDLPGLPDLPLYVLAEAARPADLDELDRLASLAPPLIRDAWREDSMTLKNVDGRYDKIPWNGTLYGASISEDGINRQLAAGIIAEVRPSEFAKIKGSVRVFGVAEPLKHRTRCITHTVGFNDHYSKQDVAKNRGNATVADALEDVLPAQGAIQLDMRCYFDFFSQSDDVSWTECFSAFGRVYRRRRLAMGKRSATSVATSATRVLLAFDMPDGVSARYATDGVRFAGPPEGCTLAAWEFVRRAHRVGFIVSGLDSSCSLSNVASLWASTNCDFIGHVVDFQRKMVCCRPRHVTRLHQFADAAFHSRALFADQVRLWAMCLYMMRILAMPAYDFYSTRMYFSALARRLAVSPLLWQKPADTPLPSELLRVVAVCARNLPATVVPAPTVKIVSFVDACVIGYAAITVWRRPDGSFEVSLLQRRWDAKTLSTMDMGHSTNSEPEAIARVSERIAADGHLIFSDHDGFIKAVAHGSSPSPVYNSRVRRCARSGLAALLFVPGCDMLADLYSRFQRTILSDEDRASAVRLAADWLGHVVGRTYQVSVTQAVR